MRVTCEVTLCALCNANYGVRSKGKVLIRKQIFECGLRISPYCLEEASDVRHCNFLHY